MKWVVSRIWHVAIPTISNLLAIWNHKKKCSSGINSQCLVGKKIIHEKKYSLPTKQNKILYKFFFGFFEFFKKSKNWNSSIWIVTGIDKSNFRLIGSVEPQKLWVSLKKKTVSAEPDWMSGQLNTYIFEHNLNFAKYSYTQILE